jgi:hypothetical protein
VEYCRRTQHSTRKEKSEKKGERELGKEWEDHRLSNSAVSTTNVGVKLYVKMMFDVLMAVHIYCIFWVLHHV